MQTYTNTQYGFSLQYPNAVQVNPPCTEDSGTQYLCSESKQISFYEKESQPSNRFAYGYVAISASTNVQAVASCIAAAPYGKTSTATINGIQFTVTGQGSAAAGTQQAYTVYNALRDGVCYAIIDDEYSHFQGGQETVSQAQADLKYIVQSFRFTESTVISNGALAASPASGKAPLTVTFSNFPNTAAEENLHFGDGKEASNGLNGWPANGKVVHTYEVPGTYTATLVGGMSNGELGRIVITVK